MSDTIDPTWPPIRPMSEAPRDGTHVLVRYRDYGDSKPAPCVVLWWRDEENGWVAPYSGNLRTYWEDLFAGWYPLPPPTPAATGATRE